MRQNIRSISKLVLFMTLILVMSFNNIVLVNDSSNNEIIVPQWDNSCKFH